MHGILWSNTQEPRKEQWLAPLREKKWAAEEQRMQKRDFFYYVLFEFWVLCHEHILTLQNRFSNIKSSFWASTKAPIPLVSNHTGLMVVHSCWDSVSVFFRSQSHPNIKGPMLRWNKIIYFSHAKKKLSLHRIQERKVRKEKIKEGQERKGKKIESIWEGRMREEK